MHVDNEAVGTSKALLFEQYRLKEVAMNRLSNPVLFKLFLVMLAIDAVLFSILAGIVLNALVNAIGFTPELVTWIAIYVSAMVIFTIILFVLVVVTVTIRVKDAQHYYQVQRRRREMELKRHRQRL